MKVRRAVDPDERNKWLENLKVGSQVVVHPASRYAKPYLAVVDRLTPAGRLKIGDMTFDPDGWQRGGMNYGRFGVHRAHLTEPTQAVRDEIERSRIADALAGMKWQSMTLDQLRATWQALQASAKPGAVAE